MLATVDPGMVSVIAYVGGLTERQPSIDPGSLYAQFVEKYEKVTHTSVFASGTESRDGLEQHVFSTIVGDFLHDYRRITNVDAIVADFGARISERRNQLLRSALTDFFSQLAATAEAVQPGERTSAQFTPAFRASLANLNLALKNGEFEGDLLDDLLRIEKLFFNPNVRFMGEGLISMIEWDTASGGPKPVYPGGFEGMFGQIIDLNPSVWRRALRAVLVAMKIHEGLTLDDRLAERDAANQEIELFTFARQSELSHVEGKAIIIPIDDQDELHEMQVRFMDDLSVGGLFPNEEDLLASAGKDARDRSLLLLLDEGLVDDARSLLGLRQRVADSSHTLGLLIHAFAAHGQLSGIRRMLFVTALKFLISYESAEIKDAATSLLGRALYHLIIPLLDFEKKEQAIQDGVTDMNAYLADYYQRKPHTETSSGGPTGSAPMSGTPAPRTPTTPAPAGGAGRLAHHDSAATRRRGARGLPHRARRIAHAFVRGARMAARL